jgi:hypothetical protein
MLVSSWVRLGSSEGWRESESDLLGNTRVTLDCMLGTWVTYQGRSSHSPGMRASTWEKCHQGFPDSSGLSQENQVSLVHLVIVQASSHSFQTELERIQVLESFHSQETNCLHTVEWIPKSKESQQGFPHSG